MDTLSWHPVMLTRLPDHCVPESEFLANFSTLFNTCVPSYLALFSTILGTLSIISWLCAQLPQIFKNYSLKSTAGLSIFFLVEWCLGDATNLVGALFTRQATWQVIIAGYYVFVDLALVVQYFWYTYYKPGLIIEGVVDGWDEGPFRGESPTASMRQVLDEQFENEGLRDDVHDRGKGKTSDDDASQPQDVRPKRSLISDYVWPPEKGTPSSSSPKRMPPTTLGFSPGPSPKTTVLITLIICLASIQPTRAAPAHAHPLRPLTSPDSRIELAGRLLSWVSTALYLGSRLPQLYKNQKRRSTAGLSPTLFIAAFFGNLFYSSSLVANPCAWNDFPPYGGGGWVGADGSARWEWVGRAAPFWLGAAGVLALDAAVGVQFLVFGEGQEKEVVVRERGRWRWRRVSGWMRGWVPSVSPTRARSRVADEGHGHGHGEGEALVHGEASGAGTYGTV